ncbi:hypothetical protein HAX54_028421, partial [Datura stramonium]|nr:hypothetical protein [Datura stramonium]
MAQELPHSDLDGSEEEYSPEYSRAPTFRILSFMFLYCGKWLLLESIMPSGALSFRDQLVYKKLKERSEKYTARGLVRTEESKQKIGGADDVYIGGYQELLRVLLLLYKVADLNSILRMANPEQVDWIGQKNQIDAGSNRASWVNGRTNPKPPLNSLGNGNILIWKRKAEQYLADSGIPYTII